MSWDFIVIGAGISGISSALTLAKNGRRVLLLEKAERTAPLLRGFSRRGVQFDTGFHYTGGLAPGEPLDIFLRYLGLSGRIDSFPFEQDGFDEFTCQAPAFRFRVPVGYAALRERLQAAFPGDCGAVASFLDQVQGTYRSFPYLNLDSEVDPNEGLGRVLGPTLAETLDALSENVLLKSLLSMHTLLYGVPCEEVSFVQHAAIVGSYYQSTRGIRGGGLALARACDARLAELGVEVRCGAEVTGIEVAADGAFAGVRLKDGEVIAGRAAIATVHPHLLLDLVPEGSFRPVYRKRLAALEETVSAFCWFAVSDNPLPGLAGCNRFLLPDPESIREIGKRGPGCGPLYLSGAYREGAAEPTGFVAICPAPPGATEKWQESRRGRRPAEYLAYKEEALSLMRRQIEAAYPDLAHGVHWLEGSTPLTLRDWCATPLGGLYGAKHRAGQYNPSPATRMPGLYLAGQAVVSPGVLGAVLSGLLACGTVLGHEHMREELRKCS